MVSGGISYYGLTNIIFVEGTMNDFAYGQALIFFKEDIEKINRKNNTHLILEQDGAPSHTSRSNINLLNESFGKNGWIQNPPNSPDLAFPIEDLWAIIKPRVKRREPKTLEELKAFILQEWNSVPLSLIRNLCDGYINRIKKVIELNGSRLESEHLKNKKKEEIYKWEIPDSLPAFRFVYNDKQVYLLRKKEIKHLKKSKKILKSSYSKDLKNKNAVKKSFKKRDLKYLSRGKRLERDKKIGEIDDKIKLLLNMPIVGYLNYLNEKNIKENQSDDDDEISLFSVSGEIEERLEKLGAIIKKNKDIKYNLKIKF